MRTIFSPEWNTPDHIVILASKSPRRRELLAKMGINFDVAAPRIENERDILDINDIERSIAKLAAAKAASVAYTRSEALVVGADTVVCHEGAILGKPVDIDEARKMLKTLSGSVHTVYTGVSLVCEQEKFIKSTVEKTDVYFRDLDDSEIDSYLRSGEYMDKAGAYAIQGLAMIFVEKISGCFYNVVGLPVYKTISLFNSYVTRKEPDND
jgi:septum formation protein